MQVATTRSVDAGQAIPDLAASGKSPSPEPLELDPAWVAERAAKRAEAPVRKRRGPIAGVIVALLIVGLVGVGIYVAMSRKPKPTSTIAGPGVSIRVTADNVVKVSIDGSYAGTTPLSLKLRKSTKQILITAPNMTPQQVIPDRDHVVHLTPP